MAVRMGIVAMVVIAPLVWLSACAQEKGEKPGMACFVKTTEISKIAFLGRQGPYDGISQAIKDLCLWAEQKRYTLVGPPMGIFLDDPQKVSPEALRWEVACAVAEDVKELIPQEAGGVGIKVLEPVTVATTYHKGAYDKVGETYKALFGWVFKNKYEVSGPVREIWWNDPEKTPETGLLSELQVPVRKP